jgi:hypothetical protein
MYCNTDHCLKKASSHSLVVSLSLEIHLNRDREKSSGQTTKYVFRKSTTVYVPSSELGLSQPPLTRQRLCPSPQNRRGGGAHSPAGEGLGESQFRRLEKKLSTLPTLWVRPALVQYLNHKSHEHNLRVIPRVKLSLLRSISSKIRRLVFLL